MSTFLYSFVISIAFASLLNGMMSKPLVNKKKTVAVLDPVFVFFITCESENIWAMVDLLVLSQPVILLIFFIIPSIMPIGYGYFSAVFTDFSIFFVNMMVIGAVFYFCIPLVFRAHWDIYEIMLIFGSVGGLLVPYLVFFVSYFYCIVLPVFGE